ncbi:MAG TPA: chemotaxis protein CheA [Candidatus Saccharimonadales bacterium]|nr:chemotaxis protein CheA [Candidatus Saccharimonadales bacterium]
MDDLINDFLVESNENLDRLDSELVKLETDPSSQELLSSIFRTIHTIKGSCGFLGFSKLEKVAHVGESLLSRLREGKLSLTPEFTTGLLAMVDAIRNMLGEIQKTGQDGNESYPDLIETLNKLQDRDQPGPQKVNPGSPSPDDIPNQNQADFMQKILAKSAAPSPDSVQVNSLAPLHHESPSVSSSAGPEEASSAPHPPEETKSANVPGETIRVDVHLLDRLMNLVGELVLTRNQITQFSARQTDPNLVSPAQQLNLLTSELQEEVMKTRMQPISTIFDKFPRVVRDVGMGCGKQVLIEMMGKDTELDKSLLEAIKDPLTHIVRNSVDHGIETPELRVARGKRAEGHLKLRACHEGGQVVIEIADDGAGIDTSRVKNKALERGLITPQQAANMSERELLNLIFLPGFSTAEKVTNLSGRGVGMDVVKTNIDRVNGSVDIHSAMGAGTTIKIKIPLTLAIVPALVVVCAGERFAIPQVSLCELVRIEADAANSKIEFVHGVPVYRLRGRLLPLVYLDQALHLERTPESAALLGSAATIVVLQADDRQLGLVVDEIIDTEEIVVKPLGKKLKGVKIFAGATIMGDGRVALIIDVLGLAQQTNIVSEVRSRNASSHDEAAEIDKNKGNRQALLLIQVGQQGRMAIPLALVARLEVFAPAAIEHSGFQDVAQYRGEIMPLVRVSDILQITAGEKDASDVIQVVVYSEKGRRVGLVVDRILDIVEENVVIQNPSHRDGIRGSMVIQSRVTDLLDIPSIVRSAQINFDQEQPPVEDLVSA